MSRVLLIAAAISLCTVHASFAEVTSVGQQGFISEHVLTLHGSPTRAYQALTAGIHLWWDADHSYSGKAGNFSLAARAGGCFCEKLDNGGSVEHMRVVFAQPAKTLRLIGGLGPLQEMGASGAMTFSLTKSDDDTTELYYRYAVSGFSTSGWNEMAKAVDQVQLGQLLRLQNYLATEKTN